MWHGLLLPLANGHGCGGGPREDNTTAFLVRSTATKWAKGSLLAVDAGTHLAAITRILEKHLPGKTPDDADEHLFTLTEGPFKGLKIPNSSASANAGYIVRTIVDTYLITHPHLDHISGFVINTASLPGTRPKRLAGLPSTINAFKEHIFNNVIWPNLSDENNGAGLVTYMRLVEGGSPAMGDGEGKGYMEICDGLSVKTWSVSHGHCIEKHTHRGSGAGLPEVSPRLGTASLSSQMDRSSRSTSGRILSPADGLRTDPLDQICVYDSSAYFIRDIASGREILMFGDVEPDSISLSPRNKQVWSEAAPKIVAGQLGAIFIECSYDDSRSEDTLFGHLAPRYLIEELKSLVAQVHAYNGRNKEKKKRKRVSERHEIRQRSTRTSLSKDGPISPLTGNGRRSFEFEVTPADGIEAQSDGAASSPTPELAMRGQGELLLKGVKVVVIHTKDKLDDGPAIGDVILQELLDWEIEEQLGCEFVVPKFGDALYF
ncbi:3',5'-cyclic-nucleotide phosphodiesterase [Lachnellula occidentalis]|uniref:3',5'-cyclic-nucleotide phosphodiesterase n=1 Tax=Lachnellula occidentalis TaxID=215460 RepID=A0A8H8S5S1_9HELO|nr:3',5'-cyclic-nucleotide phosphodiesterase [Lachnellula occidentalis]